MSFTTQRNNYSQNDLFILEFYVDLHNEIGDRIDNLYQIQNNIRDSINEIITNRRNYSNLEQERNRNGNGNRNTRSRQQDMRSDQMRNQLNMETNRENEFLGGRYADYFRGDQTNESLQSHYLRGRSTPFNRGRNTRRNGNQIFTTIIDSFYENVRVVPTLLQIQNATRLVNFSQIENPLNNSCPISLERFENNSPVVEILHCHHLFHPESLNSWFSENVRCPVCRYDIRDYQREREREATTVPTTNPNPVPTSSNISQNDSNLNNSLLELTETLLSQFMNSPTNLFDIPSSTYHFDPSFNSFTINQFPTNRF
jgi:hypothetical protein